MADEPETPASAQQIADELALLTILADRVAAEVAARKAVIASTWTAKTRVAMQLPNPDNPARPLEVGTVRADGGQGVARIADLAAWQEWCKQHVPHNVVQQPEGVTSWALDDKSRAALEDAYERANLVTGFGADHAGVLLARLEELGYTLTKVEKIPARTVVLDAWEKGTLEATQKVGAPSCPDGQIPDGIEFVPPSTVVRPVVTVKKDDALRQQFVNMHTGRLAELTGAAVAPEPKEARNGG